ncbi:MAG: Serine/threonine protein kinase [Cyanobacteriota bacterium]
MTTLFKLGELFHERYLIQLELGQGRLSRNYLANDTHRFDEPCLVKVFAPDLDYLVSQLISVESALKVFQQQAKTLYALEHPQIANFREFFRIRSRDNSQYYLVQDFIEGQTYQDLLSLRRGQDKTFTEAEIQQLFQQLLPVLFYLHQQGVFHRQLTPANIVRRDIDGLAMLVNFSDAPVENLDGLSHGGNLTRDPGVGHDLCCLGVSGLTLLTGQALPCPGTSQLPWPTLLDPLPLSPGFRHFLLNLLMGPPQSDFDDAKVALAALEALPAPPSLNAVKTTSQPSSSLNLGLPQPHLADNEPSLAIPPTTLPPATLPAPTAVPPPTSVPTPPTAPPPSGIKPAPPSMPPLPLPKLMLNPQKIVGLVKNILWLIGAMAIAAGTGWGTGKLWLNWQAQANLTPEQAVPPPPKTKTALELKNEIRARRLNLGLSPQAFQLLLNDWLAFKIAPIPLESPIALPSSPGSEAVQIQTAIALLTALEPLSPKAINLLSQNRPGDRRRWIARVNRLRLSSRSFNDLVNARFRHYFPELDPDTLADRPLEQLWNAYAFDSLASLEDESRYQRVSLLAETSLSLSGQLEPGEGYAYAINLPQGQLLDLQLTAPPPTQTSIYSPSGQERMLENSLNHQWSGLLNETGYYELIITSGSSDPIMFQLQLQIR